MRLYRHLSVFLFAVLPVYSFNFWWCSALSPFGVEPPKLPCGLAWEFLPFFPETMPSDLPCTIVLDVSNFPAAASRVHISSAIVHRFTANKVRQLRASLCKILISSFAHKMDFANKFSVDFF